LHDDGDGNDRAGRGDAPGRGPRSRWLVVVGLGIAAAIVAIVVIALRPAPEARRAPPPETPDVAAAPRAVATAPATPNAIEREALPEPVRRYLDATVYPPGTGRLTAAHEDLLRPNQRYEDFRKVLDTYSTNPDEVVSVRLTTDHYYYTGDDVVRLDLRVRRGQAPIDPISIEATAAREGRDGASGDRVLIRFRRDGEAHVAEIDTARFADHHGPIVVEADIEYAPGKRHHETLRFFFTPPGHIPARFTGEVDDRLEHGALVVGVGLDVEAPGFYRLDANLYDRRGRPLGYASGTGELDRGRRRVPIEFFGRLLRDVGESGPFTVGEIRGYRFINGAYPDRERIPDLPGRFPTRDYALGDFSPAEYTSAHKERMVQLMLEDVRNGISIDAPPVPNAPATGAPAAGADPG
jgi:hypothetical protein